MKKLLLLIMTLALACSLLAGCEYMNPADSDNPVAGAFDSVKGFFGNLFGLENTDDNTGDTNDDVETPKPHEHNFVLVKTSKATCSRDGKEMYECECGEKKEVKTDDAFGHNMKKARETKVTCEQAGSIVYKCSVCGTKEEERFAPLGHDYGESTEASRLIPCTREGCVHGKLPTSNGKYQDVLVFSFTKEDEEEIEEKYNEILALLNAAEDYDAAHHGYSETGALADAYLVIDEKHTALYELVLNAVTQRQLAEILYYGNTGNAQLKDTYSYMMEYYTGMISMFYSLSQPFYDSMYREFFYYGMTEQEILAYLADSNALADEEYTALTARNAEIEVEYQSIGNPETNADVLSLYFEFVQNNKRIAEIMEYDNYLEYAYESVYDRDYSYQDIAEYREYVKRYIAPVYCELYAKYVELMNDPTFVSKASDEYNVQFEASFFNNVTANTLLNDYIDLLAIDTDKMQTSFSNEFNNLMGDGNMFRGNYRGAFVTRLSALDLPVAYFGSGYDGTFTVAHEFGHYMNEIYNPDASGQSFDLLEMHSQGNEVLYLSYLKDHLTEEGYSLVKVYQLLNMLYTAVTALTVDTFEQAVYLDTYDGRHASTIMADNTITADEYDLLYQSILIDFGIQDWNSAEYWRYVTITSPCYYVSYSVSAISVLQIYQMANEQSFDAACDSYLKLFTYTDDYDVLTTEEVLVYSGLRSFTDSMMFMELSEFLTEDIG